MIDTAIPMLAEITFTPGQLYSVIGILVFLLTGILLARSVFNYAKKEDLEKLGEVLKVELEKHSIARHDMRREISRVELAVGKIEAKLEDLPEIICARLNRPSKSNQ